MTEIRNINGKTIAHDIEYDDATWQKKMNEAFKIGYIIEGSPFFVKRYYDTPNGKGLIEKLIGQPVQYIPKVCDFVKQHEGHRNAYYYITELIDGKTLDVCLKDNEFVLRDMSLYKIANDLCEALKEINALGYWFSDLNDQNIMYSPTADRYYLIDVDSAWSDDYVPESDSKKNGGLPSNSLDYGFKGLEFLKRCSTTVNNLNFGSVSGIGLNYLQVLALVARLKVYKEQRKQKANATFSKSDTPQILDLMCDSDEPKALHIAEMVLSGRKSNLDYKFVNSIKELAKSIQNADFNTATSVHIRSFNTSKMYVKKGEKFKLEWDVSGCTHVELRGGRLGTLTQANVGSCETELDSNDVYTLIAKDENGKTVIKTLDVTVDTTVVVPEIIYLKSSKDRMDKGDSVDITWSVLDAEKVFFNGEPVGKKGHQKMSPNKTQIYKLIARNGTESIEKELKIEINANPLQKWLIAAIIALPLLFFGYKGWEGMRLNSMDCHTAFNTANKLYQKENYGSASAYFKRSIEAGGLTKEEVAESHYHLAVSLRESGGKAAAADANKHFDDAIRLYTDLKNLPMLDEVVRKSLEK